MVVGKNLASVSLPELTHLKGLRRGRKIGSGGRQRVGGGREGRGGDRIPLFAPALMKP